MVFSELLLTFGRLVASLITSAGYFGVYVLMILESMVFPIPSELVMPLAGFLAYTGQFSFWMVCIVATIGTITGSIISYYMGAKGGNPLFIKYGKYFLLDIADLEKAEEWFRKSGEITILAGRLVPVVRHLISIVAGVAKMDIGKVIVYTAIGGFIWNTFLAGAGYLLGQNWRLIKHYLEPISLIVLLLMAGLAVFFFYRRIRDRAHKKEITKELIMEGKIIKEDLPK
ncbi:MAG: DedA family protein [Candidatus Nanoarchaeia archaeon]|nr:DedA family protein [Candidatus Nanoarchaeia archaeon]MDD5239521.1 DedA family protein [Candidatus Nanoarchaeia archaeon]